MSEYYTPAQTARFEQEIKKSRFIAYAARVESRDQLDIFLAEKRREYADAGHCCSAYIIGDPGTSNQLGCSDDGEPSGTAGMPILSVLQHGEVGDIVIAVLRYFGGIKLGTGGLSRAYSSSASAVIKVLTLQAKITFKTVSFYCPFALEDFVRRRLHIAQAVNLSIQYDEQLHVSCDLPESQWTLLEKDLKEASRGQINFIS